MCPQLTRITDVICVGTLKAANDANLLREFQISHILCTTNACEQLDAVSSASAASSSGSAVAQHPVATSQQVEHILDVLSESLFACWPRCLDYLTAGMCIV